MVMVCFLYRLLYICPCNRFALKGKFGPSRQARYTLEGDASLILWRDVFGGYDATQDYTIGTLPALIGSIGGLWSAFGGVLGGIFGTSMAFIVFGKDSSHSLLPDFTINYIT